MITLEVFEPRLFRCGVRGAGGADVDPTLQAEVVRAAGGVDVDPTLQAEVAESKHRLPDDGSRPWMDCKIHFFTLHSHMDWIFSFPNVAERYTASGYLITD